MKVHWKDKLLCGVWAVTILLSLVAYHNNEYQTGNMQEMNQN